MTSYEQNAIGELRLWQREMQRKPSIGGIIAQKLQGKMNSYVPEKVHKAITTAFRHTVQALLKGAGLISGAPLVGQGLETREQRVRGRIDFYRDTAMAEGAITGAGGILLGLADFPIWLTLKMKMLSEIALLYGYDISDYKERMYILYVFQLAFSTRQHRRHIYATVAQWEDASRNLPEPDEFDWRKFQQEYRDYIDLAKLMQLIPGVGAVVGGYVNRTYTERLGKTAMNAYRMRYFATGKNVTKAE